MKLEDLTVSELREEASKYPEITGVHSMKKAEIVEAITKASGQPEKKERKADKKAGDGKEALKKKIRTLKTQRNDALGNKDAKTLKSIRTNMKKLKRKTRKFTATVSESS